MPYCQSNIAKSKLKYMNLPWILIAAVAWWTRIYYSFTEHVFSGLYQALVQACYGNSQDMQNLSSKTSYSNLVKLTIQVHSPMGKKDVLVWHKNSSFAPTFNLVPWTSHSFFLEYTQNKPQDLAPTVPHSWMPFSFNCLNPSYLLMMYNVQARHWCKYWICDDEQSQTQELSL